MKKYILILAAAGLMSGCYDLDQYPHDKLSSGTFWKTETHAHQGMVAMYNTLLNENVFGAYYNNDALGEIAMDYNNWQMPAIIKGTYTERTSFIQKKWQTAYEGVFRANLMLQNIDGVEMDNARKTVYKGEARFMRALYYFHLFDFYGGVPLYDETTIVANEFMNMKKPRSSADETVKFILDDLDEAVRTLPVKWENTEYGRATRGAAVALRGKVKLFTKDYAGAKADFEEIVKDPEGRGYGYRLNDSYPDLFTLEADQSAEMIFTIQCVNGTNNNYGLAYCLRMGTRAAFGGCWNNCMPTDILADMYEYKDGRPFSWNQIYPGFSADRELQKSIFQAELTADNKKVAKYPADKDKIRGVYENRDPRLEQTLITPYCHFLGCNGRTPKDMEYVLATGVNEANGFLRDNLGHNNYYWRKFVPEGDMNGILDDRDYSPVDFPLIRYADVLLMLAECYNETGMQDQAVDMINQVRQRPSTNMPELNSGPEWLEARSKEEVFQRIVHERAVELACEGHRFSDLKRWGIAKERLNYEYDDILGKFIFKRIFTDRDYLFPIPAVEFERNPNLGQQNPKW
ncbi:RagB/SusD family nutrient uptake outer membrane protein [Bacteroides fluxus]|jgi:hypothetical protein